jgi:hypothetical protein
VRGRQVHSNVTLCRTCTYTNVSLINSIHNNAS